MGRRTQQQSSTGADSTSKRSLTGKRTLNVIVSSDEEEGNCGQQQPSSSECAVMDLTTQSVAIPESQPIPPLFDYEDDEADIYEGDEAASETPQPAAKKAKKTDASHLIYIKTWFNEPNLKDIPTAPPNKATLPDECASTLFLQPQARIAYRFGDMKYAVLAGNGPDEDRYEIHIRQFGAVKGTNILYGSNQYFVKLDAQQSCNFIYELEHFRNLMHDGGPRFGAHIAHIGKSVQVSLNPEFGPALDVRQFYLPKGDNEEKATKKGIRMSLDEFEVLCVALQALRTKWPRLQKVKPCQIVHNQEQIIEGVKPCIYCNPPAAKNLA